MIDCIAGYHLNPWTCGIAKFNAILARYLAVPVVGLRAVELGSYGRDNQRGVPRWYPGYCNTYAAVAHAQ